mmetsp:Transcript_26405/g.55043  ORF Transcript_26405/g.55043 Transcript_26405/m.55043 type:complete len:191 (-) Transcript_26405:35-607(-)
MLRLLLLSRRGLPLPSAPSSSAFGFRPFSTPAASPPPTPPPADGEAATKRKQAAPGQPSDRSHIPQGLNSTGKWMWVGTQENKYKVPLELSNLSQFFAPDSERNLPSGRAWKARELRHKSFDDLHNLWFVLYKEYNLLWTEQGMARRRGQIWVDPERKKKVKKSMAAIKQVLGERHRGVVYGEEGGDGEE